MRDRTSKKVSRVVAGLGSQQHRGRMAIDTTHAPVRMSMQRGTSFLDPKGAHSGVA